MMIPPIVGVPAFAWWPSGPSSRMNWPNSRSRRNAMNVGDRKMQISSAALPAIRTSPMLLQGLGDRFQADAPRRLHEHGVARRHQAADERRRLAGVGGRAGLAAERPGHVRGAGPDRDQNVDAALARVRADLLVEAHLARPELEHVAEHRDAAPARRR